MNLREKLIKQGKIKWLDIGCNKNFEPDFWYMDVWPKNKIDIKNRARYFRMNILHARNSELKKLSKFDMVRMQHAIEHFSYEDGVKILRNISIILKPGGIILITAPDLEINIQKYLSNSYKGWGAFNWWANKRIPKDAPASFYFSIYAHSLTMTPHKWCYDSNGLQYLLNLSGCYKNIKELKFIDKLSNHPFTHNRPEEDVCIIAINNN